MSDTPSHSIPSLGEFLRQERESRGLTIEQVASATKISVKHLHYLESDQYSDLPARPFVRGFILSYCRFIGIDGNEVLTRYNDFIARKSEERPSRDSGHSGYAFERKEGDQTKTVLWVSLASFLIVGAVAVLLLKPNFKKHRTSPVEKLKTPPKPTPEDSPSPSPSPSASSTLTTSSSASDSPSSSLKKTTVKPSPVSTPTPKPAPKPSPTSAPEPAPTPTPTAAIPATKEKSDPLNSGVNLKTSEIKHKLIIKALEDQWVRFKVDQRSAMKFILRKDRILVLRAKETVVFQCSHPAHITLNYNSSGPRSFVGDRRAVQKDKDLTLFIPAQLAESIDEPFPNTRPIAGAVVPAPWRPNAEPPIEP